MQVCRADEAASRRAEAERLLAEAEGRLAAALQSSSQLQVAASSPDTPPRHLALSAPTSEGFALPLALPPPSHPYARRDGRVAAFRPAPALAVPPPLATLARDALA